MAAGLDFLSNRRAFLRLSTLGVPALVVTAPLAACAAPVRVYDMSVHRDPGCGCCHGWATLLDRSGRFRTTLTDEADMRALKKKLGVPENLASCHTAEVGGYVIEGHVPGADILRALEAPSGHIRGLAVPGMPLGSPGMELADGSKEAFDVFAFAANGDQRVYAHYAA